MRKGRTVPKWKYMETPTSHMEKKTECLVEFEKSGVFTVKVKSKEIHKWDGKDIDFSKLVNGVEAELKDYYTKGYYGQILSYTFVLLSIVLIVAVGLGSLQKAILCGAPSLTVTAICFVAVRMHRNRLQNAVERSITGWLEAVKAPVHCEFHGPSWLNQGASLHVYRL